jgi:hypothetical protein
MMAYEGPKRVGGDNNTVLQRDYFFERKNQLILFKKCFWNFFKTRSADFKKRKF